MNKLGKFALIGWTAIGLGATLLTVHADNRRCSDRWHTSKWSEKDKEKYAARIQERLTALHDALNLAPEQGSAWDAFAEKIKPAPAQAGRDRVVSEKLPAPERMERLLSLMKDREKRMATEARAVKEFYAALTPAQQQVFDEQFARRDRQPASR